MSCSDETYKHILDAGRGFGVALYALILFVLWYCCPELEIFNLEGIWAGLLHAVCLAVFGMVSGYLTRRWIATKLKQDVDLVEVNQSAKRLGWLMLAIVFVGIVIMTFNA